MRHHHPLRLLELQGGSAENQCLFSIGGKNSTSGLTDKTAIELWWIILTKILSVFWQLSKHYHQWQSNFQLDLWTVAVTSFSNWFWKILRTKIIFLTQSLVLLPTYWFGYQIDEEWWYLLKTRPGYSCFKRVSLVWKSKIWFSKSTSIFW